MVWVGQGGMRWVGMVNFHPVPCSTLQQPIPVIIDPICRNFCMVLSMCLRLVLVNYLFSLRDINLTLGLLPPRRHVVWRDSVGVESSGSELNQSARIFSTRALWLLRHTDEPQRGRNSCLWLQSRSVLSSFDVVLMSCRVNFHVVRSALQYSACRI